MPLGPMDNASTPQGYMTPDQISQMYQYSGGLTQGGMRDKEITSPWQGARMMADALAGRSMRGQAGQQQMGNNQLDAATKGMQAPPLSSPSPPSQPPSMQGTPTPPMPPQMSGGPLPGLNGSMPSATPGGPPGGQPGMMGGMQPGMPPNPMMQALMTQPPGMG